MTIQEAISAGYTVEYIYPGVKIGDTLSLRKGRSFVPGETPVGWDRWGPIMAPMYDHCQVTLQSEEDLEFLRRQK